VGHKTIYLQRGYVPRKPVIKDKAPKAKEHTYQNTVPRKPAIKYKVHPTLPAVGHLDMMVGLTQYSG